jgi:hypothetical protein
MFDVKTDDAEGVLRSSLAAGVCGMEALTAAVAMGNARVRDPQA